MPSRGIRLAGLSYGALAVLALGWGWAAGRPNLLFHPAPRTDLGRPVAVALSLALGLGLALVIVAMTRVLVKRTRWARTLHREFRSLLGALSGGQVFFFAASSAVAEELFFRGAMQPALGLYGTSLVFGALHVGPGRRFLPWTAWATLMGLAFGVLFEGTGVLLGPILAHGLINYENMHFIAAYDPDQDRPDGSPPAWPRRRDPDSPSLVGSRTRVGQGHGPDQNGNSG